MKMAMNAIQAGKTTVVTGGAAGIGLAAAQRFAQKGMNIVLVDVRAELFEAAENLLSAKGAPNVMTRQVDVSDRVAVKALETGHLRVYNQPWADGKGPAAVAMDYAPWFFAGFGAIYGAGIGVAELLSGSGQFAASSFGWLFLLVLILSIAVPVWGYRRRSFKRHGHSGCRPVERKSS